MKPTPTPEMIEAGARAVAKVMAEKRNEIYRLQGREKLVLTDEEIANSVERSWRLHKQDTEAALSAALSVQPAAAVVGEPVPSLETLQYYRDAHSDKFGWVKAPIRVVEDACGSLELLVAENAKFRKALAKIAERADDNLPMYTPGAMVHTAEEALGGKP